MNAPLRLVGMTLRGIGSYIQGARLDIHPLTILCGENGSGKSTWIRVLNILRGASQHYALPVHFNVDDDTLASYDLTNAAVMHSSARQVLDLDDLSAERAYGPPGTIGLEFIVPSILPFEELALPTCFCDGPLMALLRNVALEKNTRIVIRMAHLSPDALPESNDCVDFVEFSAGDQCVQFRRSSRGSDYAFSASGIAKGEHATSLHLGTATLEVDPERVQASSACSLGNDDLRILVQALLRRIHELFDLFFQGYFHIGAVRVPHQDSEIEDFDPAVGDPDKSRDVGVDGRDTFRCERRYAYSPLDLPSRVERDTIASTHYPLVVETFVSYWLNRLTQTRILLKDDSSGSNLGSLSDEWENTAQIVNASLRSSEPVMADDFPPDVDWNRGDLTRFTNPCFGPRDEIVTPARLSAGFHQIAPIVVQAALMRPDELVAIENPEVHLHPALQLEIAEFLLLQAAAGKCILVETHSDLFLRRVMRELMSEELGIGQQAVNVAFVELATNRGYARSQVRRLALNDQHQIDNWPAGFLGDDIRESRKLFETMYGVLPESPVEDD